MDLSDKANRLVKQLDTALTLHLIRELVANPEIIANTPNAGTKSPVVLTSTK